MKKYNSKPFENVHDAKAAWDSVSKGLKITPFYSFLKKSNNKDFQEVGLSFIVQHQWEQADVDKIIEPLGLERVGTLFIE